MRTHRYMQIAVYLLCAAFCVLSAVTAVNAIPIAEGESFTWCFDTSTLPQGALADEIWWNTSVIQDLYDTGEIYLNEFSNEIGSSVIAAGFRWKPGPEPNPPTSEMLQHVNFFPDLWTVDEDIYLTLTMIEGSLNVDSTTLTQLTLDGVAVPLHIKGSPVPEPATMLLFGIGLIGLAGWGRWKSE